MSALAERVAGTIDCPECGRRTCFVFPNGGHHCFHPRCSYHATAKNTRGEPLLPKRKKPKRSRRALIGFHDLPPADPRHPYLRSHRHRGDFALQIEGLDIRQDGNRLAIGMYDRKGVLRNIQFIGPDGTKRNLKGCAKRGLFHRIGSGETEKVGLAEGWATGASFHEAIGLDTYVAFGCDNLASVASHLASIGKRVVVCGDVGQHSGLVAEEVAAAVDGELYIPMFPNGDPGSDANDFARKYGLQKLRVDTERNTHAIPPRPDPVELLAELTISQYTEMRELVANEWGIKVADLDAEVKAKRQEFRFPKTIPSSKPVDGAELLEDLEALIAKHVLISDSAILAVALWVLMTWCMDELNTSPMLALLSPEKRCGKTTTLSVCQRLVLRPLLVSNISPAAVFRAIEAFQPTLLADEVDSYIAKNDELRGILNSGHTRDAAYVLRCVGDDHLPRRFSTWSAKAIAAIGTIPDTLQDRAIVLPMRRKLPNERTARLRREEPGDAFEQTRSRIARWIADNTLELDAEKVRRVKDLNDRANDNWRPLLQIAKRLGGAAVLKRARKAALTLAANDTTDQDSNGVLLLDDLKKLFDGTDEKRLTTKWILAQLKSLDDRPWSEFRRGEPITAPQLAAMMKPFGAKPRVMKTADKQTARGYRRRDCEDAFRRYCDNEA